jgi:hypothetical protein
LTHEIEVVDPADPRVMSGSIWDDLCDTLRAAGLLVTGEGVPSSPRDRAEGVRYLTRFLAAGNVACVSHDDPDYPVFGRLMDVTMPWGLDAPDCLYLHAAVRGDAVYRIHGNRGSANHLDIQVNFGHFADGDIASWGTVSSLSGFELDCDASGEFELFLDATERPGNWLRLTPNVEFVMFRQYFNDWENERPADVLIERVGAPLPPPAPTTDQIAARIDKLRRWLERGGALWERMSRGLLDMEPNSLRIHLPIDFGGRQSSLNGHQAELDRDGVFRGVISARDPGVPNWLDNAGYERGSVAARFLRAEAAPVPRLHRVKLSEVRSLLPADTPHIGADARREALAQRRRSVLRRYRR